MPLDKDSLSQILKYLEPEEVATCARVSKSWHAACNQEDLWRFFYTAKNQQSPSKVISAKQAVIGQIKVEKLKKIREEYLNQPNKTAGETHNIYVDLPKFYPLIEAGLISTPTLFNLTAQQRNRITSNIDKILKGTVTVENLLVEDEEVTSLSETEYKN